MVSGWKAVLLDVPRSLSADLTYGQAQWRAPRPARASSLTPPVIDFPAMSALGGGQSTEPLSGEPWLRGRTVRSGPASGTPRVTLDVLLDLRAHFSAHKPGTGGTPLLRRHASCVRTADINRAAEGTPLGALPPLAF